MLKRKTEPSFKKVSIHSFYSRQGDGEMKSLSEAPEHGKGLGWEGPGSDSAVWSLVTPCRTLTAETPT